MLEPLEEAAAKACLAAADDLLLVDLAPSAAVGGRNPNPPPPALAGPGDFLLDFFDPAEGFPAVDTVPGLEVEGGGGEEEELEWLSNKDAFPALETSFEFSAHSGTSVGGGGAVAAAEERPSPVSVLVATFRVPARPRSDGRRRRRKVLSGISLRPPERLPPPPPSPAAAAGERRRCRHCEAEETPQWRAGPEGPKTLCNACGVRYKSGRLVPEYRPANSPTFSAAIHSNSHRQILEMRRGKSATPRDRRNGGAAQSTAVAGPPM